jgi:hypothetical protein
VAKYLTSMGKGVDEKVKARGLTDSLVALFH